MLIILEIENLVDPLNDPSPICNVFKFGKSIILNVIYVDNTWNS